MGPGPESWDSPIPAGNCGPVSSDLHVLDRRVRILYKFMFYIYISKLIFDLTLRGEAVRAGNLIEMSLYRVLHVVPLI
jgi:hypothetical protein